VLGLLSPRPSTWPDAADYLACCWRSGKTSTAYDSLHRGLNVADTGPGP
jgi:hypothetical protein